MNDLNQKLISFAAAYPGISSGAFSYNDTTRLITNYLPDLLYKELKLTDNDYNIYGSVGNGNWAEITWLGILDKRITKSTTKGYYIVYIFDSKLENLYLCLSLGWTQFEEEFGVKEGRQKIKIYRDHYARLLHDKAGFDSNEIQLHAVNNLGKGYEAGTLLSRRYPINQLNDFDLIDDLHKLMVVYEDLKNIVGDNILNLSVDSESSDLTVDDFKEEIARSTFKEISDELIEEILSKTNNKPREVKQRMINQIVRNRKFATYIKQKQKYVCEICKRDPFIQKNGQPYAEADHIIPIGGATRGLDSPDNLRCLCAQCHAVVTHGSEDEIRKLLA